MSDAALLLGFIDPNYFLGGAIVLDHAAAHDAIARDVAAPLDVDVHRAATAIIEVATENMVQAIVDITVAQGVDPADSVLIGGGGAAGLNSLYIARRLGVKRLLVPETGAMLSAAGALLSDLTAEFSEVHFATTRDTRWDRIGNALQRLEAKCRTFAEGPGAGAEESSVTVVAEARYESQVWEIDVPIDPDGFGESNAIRKFRSDFDREHKKLFTVEDPRSVVEIVALRASIRCRIARNRSFRLAPASVGTAIERGTRRVHFPGQGVVITPVRRLDALPEGEMFDGPAILESPFTTVVIDSKARYIRQPSGTLAIFP